MSLILQSSGGGQITIQEPATASNFTQTLPAADGVTMVSGNMPAFSAYQSSAQTLSSSTTTKLQFQTEEFDTANAFDSTTNFRFTPQVAGYYQVNAAMTANSAFTSGRIWIYKNGASAKRGTYISVNGGEFIVSALIYLNGSTDYIEAYGEMTIGQTLTNSADQTYFQAILVRTA